MLDNRQITRMVEMYNEQKNTVAEICKIYDICVPSFYNYLAKNSKLIIFPNTGHLVSLEKPYKWIWAIADMFNDM